MDLRAAERSVVACKPRLVIHAGEPPGLTSVARALGSDTRTSASARSTSSFMARVFISYRRQDSAGHARAPYERLRPRFSGQRLTDVAGSILPGGGLRRRDRKDHQHLSGWHVPVRTVAHHTGR